MQRRKHFKAQMLLAHPNATVIFKNKPEFQLNELVYCARRDEQMGDLDSEEIRLATSYALCKLGTEAKCF